MSTLEQITDTANIAETLAREMKRPEIISDEGIANDPRHATRLE
jgi:hypothetical protein